MQQFFGALLFHFQDYLQAPVLFKALWKESSY